MVKHLYEIPEFTPYTKTEKVLVYQRVLQQLLHGLKTENYLGLCTYMGKAELFYGFSFTHKAFSDNEPMELSVFPELLKYRPIHRVTSWGGEGGSFWFPLNEEGHKQRIAIIKEILLHGLD